MTFNTFDITPLRSRYYQAVTIAVLALLTAVIFKIKGVYLYAFFPAAALRSMIIFWCALGAQWLYSFYDRSKIKKLEAIDSFEEKAGMYQSVYRHRLIQRIISSLLIAVLFSLTANKFFFWFLVYDTVITLSSFPNKTYIRKLLKDDDIIFTG